MASRSMASFRIPIRVRPSASRPGVGGRHEGAYGPALVVAVNAPAVDGQATEAAVRAVAKALRLRVADIAVLLGTTSRDKLLEVVDPPADLAERVSALRDGTSDRRDGTSDRRDGTSDRRAAQHAGQRARRRASQDRASG
jgi:uncharacterized protein YggU (UPF0235/DUF167 family)